MYLIFVLALLAVLLAAVLGHVGIITALICGVVIVVVWSIVSGQAFWGGPRGGGL